MNVHMCTYFDYIFNVTGDGQVVVHVFFVSVVLLYTYIGAHGTHVASIAATYGCSTCVFFVSVVLLYT